MAIAFRFGLIGLYSLFAAIGAILCYGMFSANAHLTWSADIVALTFVPWLMFIASILALQIRERQPSLFLLGQVAIVGVLLLITALGHAFPEKSRPYAYVHLIAAFAFTLLNGYLLVAGKWFFPSKA